jgi:nucleoside-diphosphate-sugar epimerase
VLGASGFIGRWVAHRLCLKEANVFLVVKDVKKANNIFTRYRISGEIIELDLLDFKGLSDLINRIKPSIIFNLAGYGVDPSERDKAIAFKTNAYLLKTICETFSFPRDDEWVGQRIIHTGSALEYGNLIGDLSEDSIPNPTTLYGKSKLKGTQILSEFCKSNSLRGITARLFTVYGPGEHKGRLLPSLLEIARTGRCLELTSGFHKRDFTYVEDVAEGLLRLGASQAKPGNIINLATGILIPVREFVEVAAEVLEISQKRLKFGQIPTRKEEMEHSPVSIRKLKHLTSWSPLTTIEDGIYKTKLFENGSYAHFSC